LQAHIVHELSLMTSILETALEEAGKAGSGRIKAISLQIGEKAGVVRDAMEFAFDVAVKGTLAEGAKLLIDMVPFKGECLSCGYQFTGDDALICSRCGGFGKITSGQELNIQYIEVE